MNGKIPALCISLCASVASLGCGSSSMETPVQTDGYRQTNLVSDVAGTAAHTDPRLVNPRGIGFGPGQPFWIADRDFGTARVFDPSGNPDIPLGIVIPPPPGSTSRPAPVAVVFNPIAQDFRLRDIPAQFLFATEDGTISTWATIGGNIPTSAVMAVDRSPDLAVYKGLAILSPECCREFLAVANFRSGSIETYNVGFSRLAPPGSFADPDLPAGYAPFNIQLIGTQVFVSYAVRDVAQHDPVLGAGNGIVSIFDQEGNFVRRFVSNGPLNAPWGMVRAGANFGPFSNDILIGNFGDGTINAFDPVTGDFLGQLKDGSGKVIINPGLWALTFRTDGVGDPNSLYFTAGSPAERHGLFGAISFRG